MSINIKLNSCFFHKLFGAQLSLFLVLISHITYFGAQISNISVLISHIANFGAQLSLFLVLISHVFTLVLNYLFPWCSKHIFSNIMTIKCTKIFFFLSFLTLIGTILSSVFIAIYYIITNGYNSYRAKVNCKFLLHI